MSGGQSSVDSLAIFTLSPLHLYVRAHSSFALSEVYRPAPLYGGVWWAQGADEELQPLLLQKLQSGKNVVE